MSKIKTCEDLRDHLLTKLDALEHGELDPDTLGTISKSCETILGSLKLQIAYAAMRNETPNIKFLQLCNQGEPNETVKKLRKD